MRVKYRVLWLLAGTVVAAAVLLRPRTEPAAPTSVPATAPADQAAGGMPARQMAGSLAPLEPPDESTGRTNLLERLLNGDGVRLTPEQISAFLTTNHRNAESLLAAFRVSEHRAYLREAKERFGSDPRVQFTAVFNSDSPEERSQWLDQLKQTAPDNALPNYLRAFDDLKAGRTEQGVQELTAAAGKAGFEDYALDFIQSAEEAYRSAGCSEAEAKMIAGMGLPLPQLAQLKQLSLNMVDLANTYRQAGDGASAQNVLQMAVNLGQQLDANGPGGRFVINNLVGLAIQLNALGAMDPASPYGSSGQTVQDYTDQLTQQKAAIKQLCIPAQGPWLLGGQSLWQDMTPSDVVSFFDRQKLYGEQAALQWYFNKR